MKYEFKKFTDDIRIRTKVSGDEGSYALHTIASANVITILSEKNNELYDSILDPNIDKLLFLVQLILPNSRKKMYVIFYPENELWFPVTSLISHDDHPMVKELVSAKTEQKVKLNNLDKVLLHKAVELYIRKHSSIK